MAERATAAVAAVLLAGAALPAQAGEVARRPFGTTPAGAVVEALTLTNDHGYAATVITLGASLQAMVMPDARGVRADIALGHATLQEYLDKREFMGAVVGRVANRVGQGRFTLDGREYKVTTNDGENALHGGTSGFDKAVWQVISTRKAASSAEVTLRHVSPDGDQGYPGAVTTTVTYRLGDDDRLVVDIAAMTDRTTVVALSHHPYWNLAGEGSPRGAMGLILQIPGDRYLPVDAGLIPTGELRSVAGTVFDFRTPRAIGERVRDVADAQIRVGRGYDHNWVVTPGVTAAPHLMARVTDPVSGRRMEVWSAQPGLQFYSGNFLDGTSAGKRGRFYRQGDAIALEPQLFPDTVNRPGFGSARLEPGQTYRNTMTYRFSVVRKRK